jgi:hypothetical protein
MISIILCFSKLVLAQKLVKVDYNSKLNCSQKFGLSTFDGKFVMTVEYDDFIIKFNSEEGQKMTNYIIAKKTDKYIIGKDESDNYSFYDIKKKQFYIIDYFMSRYSTSGYGISYSDVKQNVLKMMDLLKNGKTQKDVIQHLVEQSEYDF